MRQLVLAGVFLVCFYTAAQAETMYVSDLAEITLRTGQGIDHKIVAMIKSGQKVEVLEPADQWTKVRLPSGKEGWVVSRFLTSKLPSSIELKELKEKHEALLAMADSPYKEISKLKDDNQRLQSELEVSQNALKELKASYEALKSKSTQLLKHQTSYQQSATELNEQKQRAEKLEEDVARLERHRYVRWFLSGAAVLIVGFLMGFSTRRQRRRSSLI